MPWSSWLQSLIILNHLMPFRGARWISAFQMTRGKSFSWIGRFKVEISHNFGGFSSSCDPRFSCAEEPVQVSLVLLPGLGVPPRVNLLLLVPDHLEPPSLTQVHLRTWRRKCKQWGWGSDTGVSYIINSNGKVKKQPKKKGCNEESTSAVCGRKERKVPHGQRENVQ